MCNFEKVTEMNGLNNAEYRDLKSIKSGETFRIFVATPDIIEPNKTYPVIYTLDANGMFGMMMDSQRIMDLGGEVPPAFIVGIGYAVEGGFTAVSNKRYRDYTPTPGGKSERLSHAISNQYFSQDSVCSADKPIESLKPGEGPAFLKFIREELKPAVESAYPVDPDNATIVGGSLGGLFAVWVLLTQPDTFQRYICCSPAIYWDKEDVWKWEKAWADENNDLSASVFVTAGALETVKLFKNTMQSLSQAGAPIKGQIKELTSVYNKYGWPRMSEITPEFVNKLDSRDYANLKIYGHILPDETHTSVMPAAISKGLRYVFDQWELEIKK